MDNKENKTRKEFEDYFEPVSKELEEHTKKMNEYLGIVDAQVESLKNAGPTKGASRYLIDSVNNAVEIMGQLQGLTKEKFNVRKTILDMERRANTGELEGEDLTELLRSMMRETKKSNEKSEKVAQESLQDTKNIDAEIEKRIKELEEE